MDELVRQVTFILRGMWHRRWLGLGVAWLVGIVAVLAVMRIPDKYEASARVYVDTQSVLKPLMSGLAVQPNIEQQVVMLSRTLMSRPNIEKLIRMADLDLAARTSQDHERMVDDVAKSVVIASAGRDNLYLLSYRDSEPAKAKRVVQSLVSMFVESGLGSKRKDTDAAKKFIDEQIKAYEKKLEDAENRLKEFKLRNMNLASADGQNYYGRINEVTAALAKARLDLREAENSRDSLKAQVSGEEPVFLPEPAPLVAAPVGNSELDGRIESLKKSLDLLRLRYTDDHPDVIGTKRVLDDLEAQREREIAATRKAAQAAEAARPRRTASVNANPVYQQLKVSLAEAEANVASLTARVREYESRYGALKSSARMVPQVEAEFAQLNRDYDINKKNYEALVARRESAELSGEMEATAGMADFRLIDPPRVSPQPVAPNRIILLGMAVLAALGAGFLASFLASQIWPTFFDARALRDVTGLPVLGSVSMVMSDARRRRERRGLVGFITGFLAFIAAFGGGFAMFVLSSARGI